jgi:hypothetical protein
MKKQIINKLELNKETLRHLSERDLQSAVGGFSRACVETGLSWCNPCPTDSCYSGGGCASGGAYCC